jgi:hypothetical protein
MTQYYFEVKDHAAGWLMRSCAECDDLDAAVAHAIQHVRRMMSEAIWEGTLLLTPWMEITSDKGEVLRILPFAEAIDTIHLEAAPRGRSKAPVWPTASQGMA